MGADSARARNANVEELIEKYMRPPASKSLLSSLSPSTRFITCRSGGPGMHLKSLEGCHEGQIP